MRNRILATFMALICAVMLMVVPAHAYAPPSGDDGIAPCAEVVQWYYRMNNGVEEMRLWSVTQGRWLTGWVPVNP